MFLAAGGGEGGVVGRILTCSWLQGGGGCREKPDVFLGAGDCVHGLGPPEKHDLGHPAEILLLEITPPFSLPPAGSSQGHRRTPEW